MKRSVAFLSAFVALTIFLFAGEDAGSPSKNTAGLRLYGGLNYLTAEAFNRGLEGQLDMWRYAASVEGSSGETNFAGAHWGFDVGADLLLPLSPRAWLQVGAAIVSASAVSQADFGPQDAVPSGHEVKITPRALSIQASLCYLVPISSFLGVRIQAGAAYFLARPEAEYRREWSDYWELDRYALKSKGFGYQAGIGLELGLNRWAAIFLEGLGRYARIPNFSGTLELTSSEEGQVLRDGDLYIYDYKLGEGAVFTFIDVLDREPSGPAFSEVRKAMVDFSGFSLNLGLILKF